MQKGDAGLRTEIQKGDADLRTEIQKGDAGLRTEMHNQMRMVLLINGGIWGTVIACIVVAVVVPILQALPQPRPHPLRPPPSFSSQRESRAPSVIRHDMGCRTRPGTAVPTGVHHLNRVGA